MENLCSTVKPKFHLAFNQLGFDIIFHVGVIMSVYVGEVADKSGVSVKDGLHSFRVALTRLDNGFIGEKSVFHGYAPPFPGVAAARQAGYAALLYFGSVHTFADFFLCPVLKVILKDFLLCLFRQEGEGGASSPS